MTNRELKICSRHIFDCLDIVQNPFIMSLSKFLVITLHRKKRPKTRSLYRRIFVYTSHYSDMHFKAPAENAESMIFYQFVIFSAMFATTLEFLVGSCKDELIFHAAIDKTNNLLNDGGTKL